MSDDETRAKSELLRNLLNQGREQEAQAQAASPPVARSAPAPEPVYREPARTTKRRRPQRTETGLFTYDQVGAVAVFILRLVALVVLFASFFGSVLAIDGDWTPTWMFWHGINPTAALIGVGIQTEITLVEWWRGARWTDPVYLVHLLIDAALTFVGYWPYIRVELTNIAATTLQRVAATAAPLLVLTLVAGVVFFVICVAVARFPESVLVKSA